MNSLTGKIFLDLLVFWALLDDLLANMPQGTLV